MSAFPGVLAVRSMAWSVNTPSERQPIRARQLAAKSAFCAFWIFPARSRVTEAIKIFLWILSVDAAGSGLDLRLPSGLCAVGGVFSIRRNTSSRA